MAHVQIQILNAPLLLLLFGVARTETPSPHCLLSAQSARPMAELSTPADLDAVMKGSNRANQMALAQQKKGDHRRHSLL